MNFNKKHIYNNTLKAIELCTLKMLDDWFPLLDLLALIFNPHCKYHIINSIRSPELNIKVNLSKCLPVISQNTSKNNHKNSETITSLKKTKIVKKSQKSKSTKNENEKKNSNSKKF